MVRISLALALIGWMSTLLPWEICMHDGEARVVLALTDDPCEDDHPPAGDGEGDDEGEGEPCEHEDLAFDWLSPDRDEAPSPTVIAPPPDTPPIYVGVAGVGHTASITPRLPRPPDWLGRWDSVCMLL